MPILQLIKNLLFDEFRISFLCKSIVDASISRTFDISLNVFKSKFLKIFILFLISLRVDFTFGNRHFELNIFSINLLIKIIQVHHWYMNCVIYLVLVSKLDVLEVMLIILLSALAILNSVFLVLLDPIVLSLLLPVIDNIFFLL